jgi:serine/threonine protein kinase
MALSVDEITTTLIRHRLVSESDLRQVTSLLREDSADEFLNLLMRRDLLTDFQVDRIKAGEPDILVVGGCKLMYRNASGSFARLYRACYLQDGGMVAMKILRERWAKDPDMVKLFHREGDLGARLKHPNIVPVYKSGTDREFHFISMEFVEGGNLRDFMKIRKKLAPAEACRFTLDMARGLEYALKFGIAHRDFKSTNVLMSASGMAKLIDFGLAADESLLNRAGTDLQQALEYSTLEKGSNAPSNDPRSDLFFLGTIFYEMVTGEPPYARTRDREERKRFSRYRDIRPVTSIDPRLPMSVAGIIDRLLQTNPNLRFQTPTEVIDALQTAMKTLGGEGSAAPSEPAESDAPKTSSVLIVENRPKQQDMLRDYLSNRGYRVLMLSDVDRALARLKTQPPDCLVLLGEVIGDRIVKDFAAATNDSLRNRPAVVAVLSEKQGDLKSKFDSMPARANVLQQPVTLRDLRHQIQATLEQK